MAISGLVIAPATPAGADPVDQTTEFTLACTAQTPVGPQAAEFPLTITAQYEPEIVRGQTTTISITQPPLEIPTEFGTESLTAAVVNVTNVVVRLKAPSPNFQVVGTSLDGGSYPGGAATIGYSEASGLIGLTLPGPIVPPASVVPPTVDIDVRAVGPAGSTGQLTVDSFQLNATVAVEGLGSFGVTITCGAPSPNNPLATLSVLTGSFVPQRPAVLQSGQAFGSCTATYPATTGGIVLLFIINIGNSPAITTTNVHTPRFLMSSVKDVPPGGTLPVSLGLSPYDFSKHMNAHAGSWVPGGALGSLFGSDQPLLNPDVTAIRNLVMEFQPPAGFTVQSVSSGAGMSATYNAGTNRIVWSRPAGAAGDIPAGPFEPPALNVELVANGGVTAPVTESPLLFKGWSFQAVASKPRITGSTSSPTLSPVTQVVNVNCGQGGQGATHATNPNNPQTSPQPSATMPPYTNTAATLIPATPYNERIGWPTAITSWPAALNVAAYNAAQPRNANVVVGTVGIADGPVANPDGPYQTDNNVPITIPVLDNDVAGSAPLDPAEVVLVDFPEHGTAIENPDGTITYSPTIGTQSPSDSFTYVVLDTEGRVSNVAAVTIGLTVRSLTQIIEVQVDGDVLTMEQDGGQVTLFEETDDGLRDVLLDGTPKDAVGLLNAITVTDRRGQGGTWAVSAQVTDFKEEQGSPDCPSTNPGSWYYQCIPGDNLGWAPMAAIQHLQVPGDVASVQAGSVAAPGTLATPTTGLGSTARQLCSSPVATLAGGTFRCGADLTLVTPASAAAQTYFATLTITLVG